MLKIAFDKTYVHPLKKNHRFPMIKYELLPEQLVRKNICVESSFFSPRSAGYKQIKNLKKIFQEKARKIIEENDII